MGLEFISRTLRTTAVLLLLFLPFGLYYLGTYNALSVFTGGVWSVLNLMFLSGLVRAAIRPGGADKAKVISLALFKFPLLYLTGYFIVKISQFQPLYLLAGFSLLLVVVILKAIGRAMFHVNDQQSNGTNIQGVA